MARKVYTTDEQITRLRRYNIVAGFGHLLQAIVFGAFLFQLKTQVLFPVTVDYMAGPPGSPIPPERVTLFEINLGAGVVAFLGLSALFHFLISSPGFFGRYSNGLKLNHNYFRWVEYSLSSSVMIDRHHRCFRSIRNLCSERIHDSFWRTSREIRDPRKQEVLAVYLWLNDWHRSLDHHHDLYNSARFNQ